MKRFRRFVALCARLTAKGVALCTAATMLVRAVSELLSTIHSLLK